MHLSVHVFFFKSQKSNLLRKSRKCILSALCYGSGLIQVQTQRLPQITPELHHTLKRFAVQHECLNQTQFRFRVWKFSPSNQTTLNLGIPRWDAWREWCFGRWQGIRPVRGVIQLGNWWTQKSIQMPVGARKEMMLWCTSLVMLNLRFHTWSNQNHASRTHQCAQLSTGVYHCALHTPMSQVGICL